MTVTDRNLFSPLGVFFLIIFGTESIVSLLGNGFILVVNGHSWFHSKKMLPCDFLLIILSLSRFLLQWVSMANQFLYYSSPETHIHSNKLEIFTFPWIYLNTASLWCAMWLNVFYCVKVTNFAYPLFSWLKLRIGVLVPRLLGISLLAFIICSLRPMMMCFEDEKSCNLTGNLPGNTSQSEAHGTNCLSFLTLVQLNFIAISFIICLMASIVVILSLWRHRRNLKKSGFSTKDFSTQAHLSVIRPLLLSLLFFILHFAAMMLVFAHVFKFGELQRLITDIFLLSYPSAHSVILIFTNPKLRKAYAHVLNIRSDSWIGYVPPE